MKDSRIGNYVPGIGMCMFRGRDLANVVRLLDGRNRDVVAITRAYAKHILGVQHPGFLSDEWDCLTLLASQYHPNATSEDDAYVDDLLMDIVQTDAPVRLAPRVSIPPVG